MSDNIENDKDFQELLRNYGPKKKKNDVCKKTEYVDDPLISQILNESNTSIDMKEHSTDDIVKLIVNGTNNLDIKDIKDDVISRDNIIFTKK